MTIQPVEQKGSREESFKAPGQARWSRILHRIFSRHLMDLAILSLLPIILSGMRDASGVLGDPDIWWHLADARILTDSHHFIHIEPYSYTVAGQRWVDPEWLSELPFWLGYRLFGLVGIYLCASLALCANLYFIYWRSYLRARNQAVALWMTALSLILMWVNAGARTILFGYIILSIELGILEAAERKKSWSLWLLPPLFSVWINLHGSWIIGLTFFAVYILCGLFRVNSGILHQEPFSRQYRTLLLGVFGACLLALFVNPYGWRLIWNPFDMALNQKLNIADVQEWQPLNLEWFIGKAAVGFIVLVILVNVLRPRTWKIFEFAFLFMAWYAAFDHARFTFLAAVVTVPAVAFDLARGLFAPTADQKTIPFMNGVVAAAVIGVVALYFPRGDSLQKGLAANFPLQTIAMIELDWRVLNEEHIGGIMDFRSKPTFIDTRWDTFEHHGVMRDYLGIIRLQGSLDLLDKYKIDHVLTQKGAPISYLLEHTLGWKILRTEGSGSKQYELFARMH